MFDGAFFCFSTTLIGRHKPNTLKAIEGEGEVP